MASENPTLLSNDDYRKILNLPNHLIAIINADGTFHRVNEESNPILGWEPIEVLGRPVSFVIHPEDWDETLGVMTGLFLGTTSVLKDFKNRCRHKDGHYRWISWTAKASGSRIYAMGTDITEKVEYEEALSVQSLVLESISEGVIICNSKGFVVFANTAAEKLFYFETEELLGRKIKILSAYETQQTKNKILEALTEISQNGIWMGEWKNLRKDGSTVYTACRVTPLDLDGDTHYVCVQRDISLKKKTDEERKVLERNYLAISERLSLAVKASNIGIWEWRPGTAYVLWDETTEAIFGFNKGEFQGTTEAYTESIHPSDRVKLWTTVENAVVQKTSYVIDHRIVRKDGSIGWVQSSGMCFYDNDGKPSRLMGTVLDITERKESENDQKFLSEVSEILASSLDYKNNLQKLSDHAVKYFCDGCFIDQMHSNGEIERIVVTHPDKKSADKIFEIHTKYKFRYQQDHPLLNSLVSGKTILVDDMEVLYPGFTKKQGQEYTDDLRSLGIKSLIILRLRGRESLLGTLTFFTLKSNNTSFNKRHIWLAEELAYRASTSLENSLLYLNSQEAIKSRDEFLSIASHELKTPLQSLTLQNHMRKRQLEKGQMNLFTSETIEKTLEQDNRQLVRINRLIDDMLDITRIQANRLTMHKEEFEFCSFVNEIVERFKPQMESLGSEVTIKVCEHILITADSYRIEQVIVNLLTNAMKYGSNKPIRIEVSSKNNKVRISVQDQGLGISPVDAERIFQRFERAVSSNEVSGLGLGLYISRQIVDQHHGSLSVASELGRGSTFTMELPL